MKEDLMDTLTVLNFSGHDISPLAQERISRDITVCPNGEQVEVVDLSRNLDMNNLETDVIDLLKKVPVPVGDWPGHSVVALPNSVGPAVCLATGILGVKGDFPTVMWTELDKTTKRYDIPHFTDLQKWVRRLKTAPFNNDQTGPKRPTQLAPSGKPRVLVLKYLTHDITSCVDSIEVCVDEYVNIVDLSQKRDLNLSKIKKEAIDLIRSAGLTKSQWTTEQPIVVFPEPAIAAVHVLAGIFGYTRKLPRMLWIGLDKESKYQVPHFTILQDLRYTARGERASVSKKP